MPDIKKIFYEKPLIIIVLLFLVLSCIDIIYAAKVKRAVIYDGSIWFSSIVSNKHTFNFILHWGVRTRGFVNFINTLPVNLTLMYLPIKSKALLASVFTLPFFLNNFLLTVFHYFLTLRTKRADIFLSSLILYCAIIIPLNLYAIVEISLAASVLMLLFHYLSADIDYKKSDIFFIVILTVISYLSTEAVVYCGLILFIISIYLAKKTESKKSRFVKLFIGINCLFMSIFQLFLFHHFALGYINESRAGLELFFYKRALKSYYYKIDVFFFCLISFVLFGHKRFEKIFTLSLIIMCIVFFVYTVKTGGYVSAGFFGKRFFPCLFLPLAFIINTVFYELDFYKNKEAVFYNCFLLVITWGILNLMFSINNSCVFEKSVKTLISRIEASPKTFINPDKDLSDFYEKGKPGSFLFNCDTYMYDSINFAKEYKIKKIIIPSSKKGCPDTFYFTDTELILPFSALPIINDYADLSELKKSFE